MNRIVFLAPVIAFIALVGFFGIGLTKDPKELPSQLIDRPLPTFDLPGIAAAPGGGPGLASVTLKGEPALLNIFASWCAACPQEHPARRRWNLRKDCAGARAALFGQHRRQGGRRP